MRRAQIIQETCAIGKKREYTGSNGEERAATGKDGNKPDLQPIQASNQKTKPEHTQKNLRKNTKPSQTQASFSPLLIGIAFFRLFELILAFSS